MPVNINNPLAQALIAEGRRRGYSDVAIATSIGNAMAESGLNPATRPGDNGTAFGGFQWRHDRFSNLKNTASRMGVDYTDPKAQAAHWFDELDGKVGSEGRWGQKLKSAQDIAAANDAVISALRPAGWSANNPRGGHNYDRRLAFAKQALEAITSGKITTADVSPSGGPNYNVPGDDLEMAKTVFEGTNEPNPMVAAMQGSQESDVLAGGSGDDDLAQPALSSSFLTGGPGALFGRPQEGWNFGDTMIRVGAAMMARDNPQGAAAVFKSIEEDEQTKRTQMAINARKKLEKQEANRTIMDRTGRELITVDPQGNVVNRTQLNPEDKALPPKTMEYLEKQKVAADTAYDVLDKLNHYRNLITEGKLDVSALSRMDNTFRNLINSDEVDEKTRNAARFAAFIEDLRNQRLLEAKGVQTEGDAVRAMQAIMPGVAGYNNKTTLALLDDAADKLEKSWRRHYQGLELGLNQYKNYDPDGIYRKEFEERNTRMSQFLPEYTKRRDAFFASGAGAGSTSQTGGSLKDAILEDYRKKNKQ